MPRKRKSGLKLNDVQRLKIINRCTITWNERMASASPKQWALLDRRLRRIGSWQRAILLRLGTATFLAQTKAGSKARGETRDEIFALRLELLDAWHAVCNRKVAAGGPPRATEKEIWTEAKRRRAERKGAELTAARRAGRVPTKLLDLPEPENGRIYRHLKAIGVVKPGPETTP